MATVGFKGLMWLPREGRITIFIGRSSSWQLLSKLCISWKRRVDDLYFGSDRAICRSQRQSSFFVNYGVSLLLIVVNIIYLSHCRVYLYGVWFPFFPHSSS